MEEEKKAFLLYHEGIDDILALPRESAGAVIQAIYVYVNTGALPKDFTPLEEMVFRHMRQGIDRNAEKWERERKKRQDRARNAANAKWKKFAEEHGTTTDELQRLMDTAAKACNSMQPQNEPCYSIPEHNNECASTPKQDILCQSMHEQIKHNTEKNNSANKVNVSVNVPVSVSGNGSVPVSVSVNDPVPVKEEVRVEKGKEEGAGGNHWEEPRPSRAAPMLRMNAVIVPDEPPKSKDGLVFGSEEYIRIFNEESDRFALPGEKPRYFADLTGPMLVNLERCEQSRLQSGRPKERSSLVRDELIAHGFW